MKRKKSVYEQRGVSATKKDIHHAIRNLEKGLFPGAFCKILPDVLAESPRHCNILHADTAGTKSGLAALAWMRSGDARVVRGVAVDALVMNLDDVACVGATSRFLVNQTLGRNAHLIPGEVVEQVIDSANELCKMLNNIGIGITCAFAGGETASVGDIVRTMDVGSSVVTRMLRKDVIDASNIGPMDIIVGISSTGQATWETEENSGIGSNGLTNGRHDTLCPFYRRYKETFAPQTKSQLIYRGRFRLSDKLPGDPRFTVEKALLSPTRTYLPLVNVVLKEIPRRHITGIIHCSGGGQTKCANFGKRLRYVKHTPFKIPALFKMLQKASGLSWHEMYQVYNMGWRFEFVVKDKKIADDIIALAKICNLEAQIVGEVRPKLGPGPNKVEIHSSTDILQYP
ncbi:MAG: AIR synthase related protein [Patescibacteria group bacterium]